MRYLSIYMMSIREGNGTPLQYSCLENPTDGGAWETAVHGVAKSLTRLSDFTSVTGNIEHFFMRTGSADCAQRMVSLSTPGLSPSFGPISCFSLARWYHPTLPLSNVTSSSGKPSLTAQLHSQLALFQILMASSSTSQTSKRT